LKISTALVLFGMVGTALGGCKLQTYGDSTCAGYLGCSAGKGQIGIAPPADAAAGEVSSLHAINTGCGKELASNRTVKGSPTGYTHFTVMGTGATLAGNIPAKAGPRTFWVRPPADYDPNKKYRTVYIGQGCGGYEVANTSTLQLFKESSGGTEEALYVALDIPRDMANQDCYDNRSGPSSQEWEAFQDIHEVVDSNYCVDNNRVYVSGYSTGGWLTDMWGCYFAGDGLHPWNGVVPAGAVLRSSNVSDAGAAAGDVSMSNAPMSEAGAGDGATSDAEADASGSEDTGIYVPVAGQRRFAPEYHIRAQAGVSGGEPDNNPSCNGPIGAIWIHDLMDSNAYSGNHDVALPRVLKMNGCYSTNPKTQPWHEDVMGTGVCVQYTDCPPAYPVVFCTTVGLGHADQHERAIPGFKIFFDELESHMTATSH
jgi:poly(3-hydroxybutyrate) depolymerase